VPSYFYLHQNKPKSRLIVDVSDADLPFTASALTADWPRSVWMVKWQKARQTGIELYYKL